MRGKHTVIRAEVLFRGRQLTIAGTELTPEERDRRDREAAEKLSKAVREYLDASDAWQRDMEGGHDYMHNAWVTAQCEGRCEELRDLVLAFESTAYAPSGQPKVLYAAARRFVRARVAMENDRGVDDYEAAHDALNKVAGRK